MDVKPLLPVNFPEELSGQQQQAILSHPPFAEWMEKIAAMKGDKIVVRDVVFFGPTKPGFIFAEAKVNGPDGKPIPGVSFIRGDSVAVLVVINPRILFGKTKTLLMRQARVPAGEPDFREIPAGMMDGGGNFAGKAAQELWEEAGIKITENMLTPLGSFYPSPGGSDEKIALFAVHFRMPGRKLRELEGKQTGNAEEGENIRLEVCDLYTMPARSGNKNGQDMKSVLAWHEYYDSLKPRL